jgi:cellobiose transport system substrate-binding protein
MSVTKHRLRSVAAVALVAITALGAAAACSSKAGTTSGSKPDKLIVDTFGEFGYDDLVKAYEQQTGIKVELRKTAQLGDYRPKLVRYLATGQGAGDVVALEEGIINEFKINPANWVDLKPLVGDLSSQYLPGSTTRQAADGKLIGLPTDVGSLAVCYRRPVQGRRLPTDRARSRALADVGQVHRTGQKYRADRQGHARLGDHGASAIIFQVGGESFYDKDLNLTNGWQRPSCRRPTAPR